MEGTSPPRRRRSARLSSADFWSAVSVGDIVELLRYAHADEQRQFYQELGLRLDYQRLGDREKVRAYLRVSRVGGGT